MESPHRTAERLMTPTAILIAVGVCFKPAAYGGFFVAGIIAPIDRHNGLLRVLSSRLS
jgi:hypothetical protein